MPSLKEFAGVWRLASSQIVQNASKAPSTQACFQVQQVRQLRVKGYLYNTLQKAYTRPRDDAKFEPMIHRRFTLPKFLIPDHQWIIRDKASDVNTPQYKHRHRLTPKHKVYRDSYPDRFAKQLDIPDNIPCSNLMLNKSKTPAEEMPQNPQRDKGAKWIGWGTPLQPDFLFHYTNLVPQMLVKRPGHRRIIVNRHNLWHGKAVPELSRRRLAISGRCVTTGSKEFPTNRGAVRRTFRHVDFRRTLWNRPATVIRMEYDPYRSGRVFLVRYPLGYGKYAYSYVLATQGVDIGDQIMSGPDAELKKGNCVPLKRVPPATEVCQIELYPGKGALFARSAGVHAIVVKHQGNGFTLVRLPSGELRLIYSECYCTIGSVSNPLHQHRNMGSQKYKFALGKFVRRSGRSAENDEHPHGGEDGYQMRRCQSYILNWPDAKGQMPYYLKRGNMFILKSSREARFEKYGVWSKHRGWRRASKTGSGTSQL